MSNYDFFFILLLFRFHCLPSSKKQIDKLRKCLVNASIIIIEYWLEAIFFVSSLFIFYFIFGPPLLNFHRWMNKISKLMMIISFPFDSIDALASLRQVSYRTIKFNYQFHSFFFFHCGALKKKIRTVHCRHLTH